MKTKKYRFILFLIAYIAVRALCAQNVQQEINAIKSNLDYLYATGTSITSEDEAYNNASDLLVLEIEQWLKENTKDNIAGYIAKSRDCLSQIATKRGKLYRVLAFVKKKDILPFYKEDEVIVVDYMHSPEPNNDNVSPKSCDDMTTTSQNSSSASTDSCPSMQNCNDVLYDTTKSHYSSISHAHTIREKEILKLNSFMDLNEYINNGRKNETIVDVGKYSNLPKNGLIYVFIHNKQGEIPAVLKMTNGVFINLASGKVELLSNFKGCGAIWIKFCN